MRTKKALREDIIRYFQKNKVVGLNAIFQKFGHSTTLIRTLSDMSNNTANSPKTIEECGELRFKVYRLAGDSK